MVCWLISSVNARRSINTYAKTLAARLDPDRTAKVTNSEQETALTDPFHFENVAALF
jgi:hypothetical protein